MVNKNDISEQLISLGLSREQVALYLSLLSKPALSPLELARLTKLNRTSIYRYLTELEQLGLVKRTLAGKSTRWTAEPADHLELMLETKLANLNSQKASLPPLIRSLSSLSSDSRSPTRVYHYQGVDGIKQLLWNTLKTKGEMVGLGYLNWNYLVGKEFAEKLRSEIISRRIKSRELANQIDSKHAYTEYKSDYPLYYQERLLTPSLLKVTHDTYIYNDVYAVLQKFQGEVFGVEIINQEIADTERQLFDILWTLAK